MPQPASNSSNVHTSRQQLCCRIVAELPQFDVIKALSAPKPSEPNRNRVWIDRPRPFDVLTPDETRAVERSAKPFHELDTPLAMCLEDPEYTRTDRDSCHRSRLRPPDDCTFTASLGNGRGESNEAPLEADVAPSQSTKFTPSSSGVGSDGEEDEQLRILGFGRIEKLRHFFGRRRVRFHPPPLRSPGLVRWRDSNQLTSHRVVQRHRRHCVNLLDACWRKSSIHELSVERLKMTNTKLRQDRLTQPRQEVLADGRAPGRNAGGRQGPLLLLPPLLEPRPKGQLQPRPLRRQTAFVLDLLNERSRDCLGIALRPTNSPRRVKPLSRLVIPAPIHTHFPHAACPLTNRSLHEGQSTSHLIQMGCRDGMGCDPVDDLSSEMVFDLGFC